MSSSTGFPKKTINNKIICCECNFTFSNSQHIKTKCWCKNPICKNCYEKHLIRAKKNNWYQEYIGVCDSCIWLDIS